MFYDCVVCLGDPCNEVHGMLLVIDTKRQRGRCLCMCLCVCNIEWSIRQDCDSGLHIVLLSTKSLKLLLFAVEGMVKLHFTWRKQRGSANRNASHYISRKH